MIARLQPLQARFHFEIEIVDIDTDRALEHRYGEHVPVLVHGAHELCRHVLDSPLVTDYLTEIS